MELCSFDHDEVCYDASRCPVCKVASAAKERIEELAEANDHLEDEISDLKSKIDDLENELENPKV